jgi:hypothetical protein
MLVIYLSVFLSAFVSVARKLWPDSSVSHWNALKIIFISRVFHYFAKVEWAKYANREKRRAPRLKQRIYIHRARLSASRIAVIAPRGRIKINMQRYTSVLLAVRCDFAAGHPHRCGSNYALSDPPRADTPLCFSPPCGRASVGMHAACKSIPGVEPGPREAQREGRAIAIPIRGACVCSQNYVRGAGTRKQIRQKQNRVGLYDEICCVVYGMQFGKRGLNIAGIFSHYSDFNVELRVQLY